MHYRGSQVEGADPRTLVPIGPSFAKDRDHVFWRSERLEDAEVHTFEHRFSRRCEATDGARCWACDGTVIDCAQCNVGPALERPRLGEAAH